MSMRGRRGQGRHRHRHGRSGGALRPAGGKLVALVGNPNTGKSVIFNYLTGLYAEVSNYPGTTVDVATGRMGPHLLVDTPGVYGISAFTDEERVTRDIVREADMVINVVDAGRLDRDLFLTLQLVDMGVPLVVVLNLIDEAAARGLIVDAEALAGLLGVPVIPTVAVTGEGLEEITRRLGDARAGCPNPELVPRIEELCRRGMSRREALLALEEDADVGPRGGNCGPGREQVYRLRRQRASSTAELVTARRPRREATGAVLGRLLMQPAVGLPFLAGVVALLYLLVGVVVAQHVVEFTEEVVMRGYYEPAVRRLLGGLFPPDSAAAQVFLGEFGVLTMTPTYLLGLLLPLVVAFYLVMAIMEDTGYLPRLAVLLDRFFVGLGLNGRAVIPVVLGFGCVTMASLATRVLATTRERRIALFLLALTIPCSAQLAVIAGLLVPLGPRYMLTYVLTVLVVFVLAGTLLDRLLPGNSSALLIDLPPLRWPLPRNVLRKTLVRAGGFLAEATPLFIYGSLAVGLLHLSGALEALQAAAAPVVSGWLHLPSEAARAFIMGFVRRDFGAAGLYALDLTPRQALGAMVTITLFVPCLASVMVIGKERGWLEGAAMWLATFFIALVVGGIAVRLPGL